MGLEGTQMAQNVRSMLKILRASCPGLSSVISVQFTLKMCVVAKNYKKTQTKLQINTNFLGGGVQGHSKSLMLILLKSMSLMLVIYISNMSVVIFNCFSLNESIAVK